MDSPDFFVKSIPYLAHQYDEQDLILYSEYSNIEDIWIQRNSKLQNDLLCHDIHFTKGLSGKFNLGINLELYDNFDNEKQQHWFQMQNAFIPLISGHHISFNGHHYSMKKLNLSSLFIINFQALPLQKYLTKSCKSPLKKGILQQKYPNFCTLHSDTPEYFRLADKYTIENIVILSM